MPCETANLENLMAAIIARVRQMGIEKWSRSVIFSYHKALATSVTHWRHVRNVGGSGMAASGLKS